VGGNRNVVERLFFGRDDAESDLTDGLLREGFLPTRAYEMALTGRKSLIIGRKGAGKSAICRQLTIEGGYEGSTALITPDDAAGDEIRRFELQGVTGDTAKSLIWRYVFAVQAARHLSAHADEPGHGKAPGSVRALRTFLRANGEMEDQHLYDRLLRGMRALQSASLSLKAFGVVEFSIEAGRASEGARAARQLEVLEQGVTAAFTDLGCAQHHPLLFLVDQLEQVWSSSPDSHATIVGLLLAAKHVNSEYSRMARCVLFLRSDIYDALNFADADKFHSDEVRITWTRTALENVARARATAALKHPVAHDELWGEIFPTAVCQEPTADYLFSRMLPRPRDAIQFLTQCRDTADEQGHQAILEEDVAAATLGFSQWKVLDLAKEYLDSYPFLNGLLGLFENTGYVVMRAALETRFEARKHTLHQEFPAYAQNLTAPGVIDVLYAVGFLGVRRGNDIVYAGGTQSPIRPGETEFHVHPCFRPALTGMNPMELPAYRPKAWTSLLLHGAVVEPPSHRGVEDHAHEVGDDHHPHGVVVGDNFAVTQHLRGSDVGFFADRDFRLLDALALSCERVLRLLGRSGLPDATRDEVSSQVTHVLDHARDRQRRLRGGTRIDVSAYVVTAANYLGSLASQLAESGIQDTGVTRLLTDEAQALIGAVGGAVGRGRGSNSSG
jgi:hypothetical protein